MYYTVSVSVCQVYFFHVDTTLSNSPCNTLYDFINNERNVYLLPPINESARKISRIVGRTRNVQLGYPVRLLGISNLVILRVLLEYPTWLFCVSSWNIQLGYSACPLGISNLVILRATLEYPTWLFRKMRHFSKGDKIYSYNLVTILCPLCIAFVFDV